MTRKEIKNKIIEKKVVAVVRLQDTSKLLKVIEAIGDGGVTVIELTMTIPNAINAIEQTSKEFGDNILLGVGSVIDAGTAVQAIEAGAKFVVSPIFKEEIVKKVIEMDLSVVPAGFTPTEIQNAYELGADFVKIFPADNLGMSFIKSIKAPLPHLNVIPTGGVTIENANEWITYGASAVGIGSALVDNKAIESSNYNLLTENAKQLCENLGLN